MFSCVYRFICCHTPLMCLSLYLLPHASRVIIALLAATRLSCVYRFICSHAPLVCLSLYLFPCASRVFIAILVPTRLSCVYRFIFSLSCVYHFVPTRLSCVYSYTCCHTPLVCLSLYLFPRASHRWAEGTRARRTRKQSIADIPRDRYNLYNRQQQQVKK